jgi:hypothetical protein
MHLSIGVDSGIPTAVQTSMGMNAGMPGDRIGDKFWVEPGDRTAGGKEGRKVGRKVGTGRELTGQTVPRSARGGCSTRRWETRLGAAGVGHLGSAPPPLVFDQPKTHAGS